MPRIVLVPVLLALAVCAPLAAQDGGATPAATPEGAAAPAGTAAAPVADAPAAEAGREVTTEALVGKWRFVDIKGEGIPDEAKEMMKQSMPTITFLADGTMLADQAGETQKGKWRVENGKLFARGEMEDAEDEPAAVRFVGDRLEIIPPDGRMVLMLARPE